MAAREVTLSSWAKGLLREAKQSRSRKTPTRPTPPISVKAFSTWPC